MCESVSCVSSNSTSSHNYISVRDLDSGIKFISSQTHADCAERVFKKDIDVIFAQHVLGQWKTLLYEVTREYVQTSTESVRLYVTQFKPQKPHSTIIMVHGLGDHQGRFIQMADYFARQGFHLFLYDQRGCGRSGGCRGDTSIQTMHSDLKQVISMANPTIPLFFYGHDFGAAIAISFVQNYQVNVQGVITTSAMLKINNINSFLVKFLSRIMPQVLVSLQVSYSYASKNNYHIKKLAEDNLQRMYLTLSSASEIIELSNSIWKNASLFRVPILLVHGKLDRVAQHNNTLEFYAQSGSRDRTVKIFEYGFHELHSDTERDRVQQLVHQWCVKQNEKGVRLGKYQYYSLFSVKLDQILEKAKNKTIFTRGVKTILLIVFLLFMLRNKLKCMQVLGMLFSKILVKTLVKS